MKKAVRDILRYSHEVGTDPSMVIGGGGNSSVKTGGELWVKASGYEMATMPPEGLLCLDLEEVLSVLEVDSKKGERDTIDALVAKRLMDARIDPPSPHIRPSVEAMLHAIMPYRLVMHTHPELSGALTCSREGRAVAEKLDIPPYLWIDYIDPGLPLAQKMAREIEAAGADVPQIIFLGKHGFIVSADSIDELKKLTRRVFREIRKQLNVKRRRQAADRVLRSLCIKPLSKKAWSEALKVTAPTIRGALENPRQVVLPHKSAFLNKLLCCEDAATLMTSGPLTPDQVVYCGVEPLFVNLDLTGDAARIHTKLRAAVLKYRKRTGGDPAVVLLPGFGAFFIGRNPSYVRVVEEMYLQSMRITLMALSFGGILPMTKKEYSYIANWSMEKYRRSLLQDQSGSHRLTGKIAVVTGAAQGVGKEIALGLAENGATVVVCDLNKRGAEETAAGIRSLYGPSRARSVEANVTSEADMQNAVLEALTHCGGLDVLIANAGILKAYKITDFPVETFRTILDVNLVGAFVSAKAAASVMRYSRSGDIIQINSKSGKQGSKYNSAYASSKFGGVGMVQSIALDLIEDGIKVNAVCPGNFLDLPLWTSPGGLFDQYRRKFGGVPREKVREIYENKVPMKRGCRVEDVVTTIMYIIEQEYETGQAYNVTGGQEMR